MELTATEAWSHILDRARSRIPEQAFRMWLARTRPLTLSSGQLAIWTHDEFAAQWIEDKYGKLLSDVAQTLFGPRLALSFQAPERGETVETRAPAPSSSAVQEGDVTTTAVAEPSSSAAALAQNVAVPQATRPPLRVGTPLNDRYTFERFVIGSNNQLAAAACHAVAESPARMYNPLFIYGGVGLGKTHLMHAIGHVIEARDAQKQVAYVSSERFTNDLITSIQEGRMADFRRRYREIDLLLIDDVHFLRDKERTQEEFFHTFNALHDARRQIVLTSDRPPKEIPGLEERLISRFEWGLVTDIKPPDFETRVAILRKKAEEDQIALSESVLHYIAHNCRYSVRELEGAIIKLLAYSSLTRREIAMDLAEEALGGTLDRRSAAVDLSPTGIRARVAESWGISVERLISKRRTKDLMVPRQVAMYLIRDLLDLPLVEIGFLFGGRDHSTVIHSIQRVDEEMKTNEEFRARVAALRAEFES